MHRFQQQAYTEDIVRPILVEQVKMETRGPILGGQVRLTQQGSSTWNGNLPLALLVALETTMMRNHVVQLFLNGKTAFQAFQIYFVDPRLVPDCYEAYFLALPWAKGYFFNRFNNISYPQY